jgi:type II secretory pathway component PulK
MAINIRIGTAFDGKGLGIAKRELATLSSSVNALRGNLLVAGAVIAGAFTLIGKSLGDAAESQKVLAQTEAVLRSTGTTANGTAQEIAAMANSLQKSTSFSDEAILSGAIQDAQSRLNLTGLATAGKINEQQVLIFERLLSVLNIDTTLARLAANQIASTQPNDSGATSRVRYLGFQQVQDLFTVAGFTPAIVKRLEDYVIFLPRATAINANTAPQSVLSAALAPLSLADTQALIAKRTQSSFHNLNELIAQLSGSQTTINPQAITLSTNYFLVNGRISLRQNAMQIQALVERSGLNTEVIWIREI